jgi:hypothetical protein
MGVTNVHRKVATAMQCTQRKNTIGTYRKLAKLIPDLPLNILDFGAGYCLGAELLGADSYEPNPREGVTPTYTRFEDIPGGYDVIVCSCVLNVLSWEDRVQVMNQIGLLLVPGGMAYITVRPWESVLSTQHYTKEGDGIRVKTTGAFQRGYTYEQLRAFIVPFGKVERISGLSNIGIRLTIPHE